MKKIQKKKNCSKKECAYSGKPCVLKPDCEDDDESCEKCGDEEGE